MQQQAPTAEQTLPTAASLGLPPDTPPEIIAAALKCGIY
jgi:hypothetical protein